MNTHKRTSSLFTAIVVLGAFIGPSLSEAIGAPTTDNPFATGATSASLSESGGASDVEPGPYLLAPTDQLDITVRGHDDLHQRISILTDGTFQFPVAGRIMAAGKTVGAVEVLIASGLTEYYKTPHVNITVVQSHAKKISVAGSAKTPGQYDYRPGLRVLEVLAACGGPAQSPELTQITLVTDGGTRSVPLDLVGLMSGADASQNLLISPGDLLLFSQKDPATAEIQVVGAVKTPGHYPVMAGGATILSLLTQAGGALDTAALTNVQILHAGQVRTLNLHPLTFDLSSPMGKTTLVAGDTLLVPVNRAKVAVLGEVKAPSVYLLPDGEALTVTDAIGLAGGTNDNGDKKHIAILRRGADGKRRTIIASIDKLSKGDSTDADTILQAGDILVIPTRHKGHSILEGLGSVSGLGFALQAL